jgi:hypothetical protein
MTEECDALAFDGINQKQIDKCLTWGIVFSVVWIWGIGSFVALIMGLKARKAVQASNGKYHGLVRVWWCILVGGVGVIWITTLVIFAYLRIYYR